VTDRGWHHDGQAWCATAADAEQMRALGADVGAVLRAGDVVILDGPLGAGKTTFTQGIGAVLRVRGAVTSPTFVIARTHPGPGPALVHVDAYRLGSEVEVEDLDLDADLAAAVTVVEWGVGKVEGLAPDRLEVLIRRAIGEQVDSQDPAGGVRSVLVRGVGPRWSVLALPGG
jgi:tRNA threonylcarbamoyladenosine biosynthesis protein TsaE